MQNCEKFLKKGIFSKNGDGEYKKKINVYLKIHDRNVCCEICNDLNYLKNKK